MSAIETSRPGFAAEGSEPRDLVSALGYTESYNYSFLSDEAVAEFGFPAADHIRVLNPIAANQALMRLSLVPGIVGNLRENRKHLDAFQLFEIGNEIHKQACGSLVETPHLAAALFSKEGDGIAGLQELKRLAESIMPGCVVTPTAKVRLFEHPARTAGIHMGGDVIGRLFELHPSFIDAGRGAVLDLDLSKTENSDHAVKYRPLRRFPVSAFDLSVITDLRHYAGAIDASLREFGAGDLVAMEFQRQYSGPPLETGRKSVSFRLTVGAPDRTLSSQEVTAIRDRIIEGMRSRGYELRV